MPNDLADALHAHGAQLQEVSRGLAEGDSARIVAALGTLTLTVATGSPQLAGLLSPFLSKAVRVAFASTATRRLQQEYARLEAAQQKAAFARDVGVAIESLLGQALIQFVRVQSQASDRVIEALGGLRQDLQEFRAEFQHTIDGADGGVRVDVQHVRAAATGVWLSEGARERVWIGEMTVSGPGSVGIHVGRR